MLNLTGVYLPVPGLFVDGLRCGQAYDWVKPKRRKVGQTVGPDPTLGGNPERAQGLLEHGRVRSNVCRKIVHDHTHTHHARVHPTIKLTLENECIYDQTHPSAVHTQNLAEMSERYICPVPAPLAQSASTMPSSRLQICAFSDGDTEGAVCSSVHQGGAALW